MKRSGQLVCAAVFAALSFTTPAAGEAAEENVRLRIGVLSDIHITTRAEQPYFEKTLRTLDAWGADGVVACGDLADLGLAQELELVAETWFRVFPDGKGSDGRPVANLMHYGDHDMSTSFWDRPQAQKAFGDAAARKAGVIFTHDRGAIWERCFREPWAPIRRKTVKGYDFVLCHYTRGEEGNEAGHCTPGLVEFFKTNAFDRTRPFFVSQHRPPRGILRIAKPIAGNQEDDGTATALFSQYPNLFAFYGHMHMSATCDKSMWQGAFNAVHVPSLCYQCTYGGRENGYNGSDRPAYAPKLPAKLMPVRIGRGARQGLFMTVTDKSVTFRRWDFGQDCALGPDWVVPVSSFALPPEEKPFSFARRARELAVPEFAPGAEVRVENARRKLRSKEEREVRIVSFPSVGAAPGSVRADDYEVTAEVWQDDVVRTFAQRRVYSPRYLNGAAHEADRVECWFLPEDVPDGWIVRYSVRPSNAYGVKGRPIATPFFTSGRNWPHVSLTNAVVAFAAPKTTDLGQLFAEEAAKDVARGLSKVTGRPVACVAEDRISPTSPETVVYVGDTKAAKAAGLDVAKLADTAAYMRAKGNRIYLAARTGMGVNNACMEFLQKYCDYWFVSVWGDGESYEPDPKLSSPDFDYVLRPAFATMSVCGGNVYPTDRKTYLKRIRDRPRWFAKRYPFERRTRTHFLNGELDGVNRISAQTSGNHSQFDYLPPEKYFKDHPDWYSMDEKGARRAVPNRNSQLCYTNPEAREEIWKNLREKILADRRENPKDPPMLYDFTQMDSCHRLCLCPECRKVTARGGDSALQLVLVNELARRMRKEFPGTVIRTFAYVSTETVPTDGTKVEPNVMIWICDLYTKCDHERPLGEKPINDGRKKILDDWFKFTPNLEIWDYMIAGPRYNVLYPEVNLKALSHDAKYFRDNGVRRFFTEHECSSEVCWDLNQFLIGQLYFNPDADPSLLLEKYCRMFGEGQWQVRWAIEGLVKRMEACGGVDADAWWSKRVAFRNRETWEPFLKWLEVAYPLVPHGSPKGIVAHLMVETCRELLPEYKMSADRTEELKRLKPLVGVWLKEALKWRLALKPEELDEYRDEIETMVAMLDVDFADKPEVFRDAKPQDVVAFEYHSTNVRYRRQVVKDEKSSVGFAFPRAASNEVAEVACGTYDETAKAALRNFSFKVPRGADDYRWYRLGVTPVTRATVLWITRSWVPNFGLGKYWHNCDGVADDNAFEVWVSARRDTPANKLYIDRVLLRRTPSE